MQVMESIDTCLGMAGEPEKLQETLIQLGIIHHMSNVKVDNFAVSKPSTWCLIINLIHTYNPACCNINCDPLYNMLSV